VQLSFTPTVLFDFIKSTILTCFGVSGEGFASVLGSPNHSLAMEHQNEKTLRELEENEESSPFLVS
jgi:hypothetical protein